MATLPVWPDPASPLGQKFFTNAKAIFAAFKGMGYDNIGALAMLANAEAESSLDSGAGGDQGGVARGLWQIHIGNRADAIKAATGIDYTSYPLPSLVDQCRAADWELKEYPYFGLAALEASKTAADGAETVCAFFERPANLAADKAKRALLAERWAVWFQKQEAA